MRGKSTTNIAVVKEGGRVSASFVILTKRQTNPRKTGLFRTKVGLGGFRWLYSALNYVKYAT
jgi:hypothetical protein